MSTAWPNTLPQAPASWSEQKKPVIVRTTPDSGPTKSRRRFTKAMTQAQMSFILTIDQQATLSNLFDSTLKGGALPVNFRHPWTLAMKDMWVTEPPTFSDNGPLAVNANLKVEFF